MEGEGFASPTNCLRYGVSLCRMRYLTLTYLMAVSAGKHATMMTLRTPLSRILLDVTRVNLVTVDAGRNIGIVLFIAVVIMGINRIAIGVGKPNFTLRLLCHEFHVAVAFRVFTRFGIYSNLCRLEIGCRGNVAIRQISMFGGKHIVNGVALHAFEIGMQASLRTTFVPHRRILLGMADSTIALQAPLHWLSEQRIGLLLARVLRFSNLWRAAHSGPQDKSEQERRNADGTCYRTLVKSIRRFVSH